jgi:hypothetical protein
MPIVTTRDLIHQTNVLAGFLPNDRLWEAKFIPDTLLRTVLRILAREFYRSCLYIETIIDNFLPSKTSLFIKQWENTVGIPDSCFDGTGDGGLVYQKAEFGNVPATGEQLYNSSTTAPGTEYNPPVSGIRFMQFGGSTKYAVFVSTAGIMGAVTACSGITTTTTTTTTTAAPTTTTTTAAPTTTTTTPAPVYYQILDCNDSSVGFSIASDTSFIPCSFMSFTRAFTSCNSSSTFSSTALTSSST